MSNIPSGWRKTTLGEFLTFQRGHDLPKQHRRPGRVPVIGSGGHAGWHDKAMAKAPGITIGRAANLGIPTLIQDDFWPLNTTLYVTDFNGNDVRFCFYLMKTLDLTGFNSGSVQPMLNRNYISSFPIVVPDVNEQHLISKALGALDDKIAVNERAAGTIDELAAAKLSRLLSRFDHAAGWRLIRLGEIAGINELAVRPTSSDHLRYIDISSVSRGRIAWPDLISWDEAPSRARRGVSFGDTIWSTVRPGRRSYALILEQDPDLVASTGFAVITPTRIGPAYLYSVVTRDEFANYLESVAEGSAYPAVRAERFADALVSLPPKSLLTDFEAEVMPLRSRAHAAERETLVLAKLRDTLLPKLISGELRIRDAERAVEESV